MRMRISELSEQEQDYLGRPVLLHTLTQPQLPPETCEGERSVRSETCEDTTTTATQHQPVTL